MCISGCPYKKIYYNWQSGKSEKCIVCYPRIEAGQPTVCSETCVGRIRYLGVLLYDADRIEAAASVQEDRELYPAQLSLFLDPHDPEVVVEARRQGVPESWIEGAQNSPVYKMAVGWKVAFPLHPPVRPRYTANERRTRQVVGGPMLTFRVLSELIKYPAPELRAETREAERILRQEGLLSEENLNGVCGFLQHLCETAQLELEAAHLDAFDRGWSTSLYLFEHIHGESRDRGQAMVKLLMRYRVHGLHLQQNELPGVGRRGCPRYG
jgi:hypothetical protein